MADSLPASKVDQIVKGAPPPNVSPARLAQSAKAASPTHSHSASIVVPPASSSQPSNDPRDALPSSPPQIYLNLLILESSLRLQYLSLRARLRLHLLLLAALLTWITAFTYLLFFRPREDGSGVGGSVYWVVESVEKLGWCGGVVTLCLFWGTGMYERSVRWPRKFVGTTNRGLRGFNLKVVIVKGSVLSEAVGWLGMLDPMGWVREKKVNFQVVPKDIEVGTAPGGNGKREHWNHHASRHGLIDEDIAPSGDVLKLLLLPKPFSPDFREGWENYRMEYWDRENARRAELRKVVKARQREVMRREGGWLWRTGWRGWSNVRLISNKTRRQLDLEKLALRERASVERLKSQEKQHRQRPENLLRSESQSRSSSRSTTPTPEPDAISGRHHVQRSSTDGTRVRRGSSASATQRRLKRAGSSTGSRRSGGETLPQDADVPQRLSTISTSPTSDDHDVNKTEESVAKPKFTSELKQEPDGL